MVAEDVDRHDDAALPRLYRDARFDNFGGDTRAGLGYSRLHIHRRLVGVRSGFEKNRDFTRSGVGCRRSEVRHIGYAIDSFLDGKEHGTGHGRGVGTGIGGRNGNAWWCDFGEPGDRQLPHGYQSEDNKQRRDYSSQYRPIDECFEHTVVLMYSSTRQASAKHARKTMR